MLFLEKWIQTHPTPSWDTPAHFVYILVGCVTILKQENEMIKKNKLQHIFLVVSVQMFSITCSQLASPQMPILWLQLRLRKNGSL